MGRNRFEEHQRSRSMWTILGFHHWQRKLGMKKNRTGRNVMCWNNPRTSSFDHDDNEIPQWEYETGYSEVEQHNTKSNTTNKSSANERMKALIAENMLKKENLKHTALGSPAQPSDRRKHPIIILRRKSATSLEPSFSTKMPDEVTPISYSRSNSKELSAKDCVDVFQIYGVNKDLFIKVLQDPNSGFTSTKAKLTKSGSFPNVEFRPSTLHHKKNETWSFPRGENFLTFSQAEKIDAPKSLKDPETRLPSQGRNRSVIKYIKKIIKQALKEKKGNTSKDELLQVSRDEKETSEQLKTVAKSQNGVSMRVRRTDSLTKSLDKYAQLFEKSFNKETIKLDHCKSLTLANENKISLKRASRFCRSISSFSDLESICSLLTEVSRDAFSSEMPISNVEDDNASTGRNSCSEQKIVSIPEETAIYTSEVYRLDKDSGDEIVLELQESLDHSCEKAKPSLVSDVEGCFEDDTVNSTKLQMLKGSELKSRYLHMDDQECLDKIEDSNFTFVKDILELSGFIANEFPEAWHSIDQPLNPSLFKETFFHTDENGIVYCQEQLLFDLTNEALLNIYNRSYTYLPKAFSITPCTRPLPNGSSVVDEVWSTVSWFLDYKPRTDQSLDDIIAQDMARGDGWMKLHTEADCIALDLEELIFNEILDEVVCS
ncbi:hypothetical protein ACFE04_015686 [Oxalis oulophora]